MLFTGSASGAALSVGDFGLGNIIHWNMGGAYIGVDIWDTNTQRILTNIAAFAVKERAPVTSAQTARAAAPARARAAIEAAINALFFAGLGYALRLGWLGMMDNLPF